MVCSVICFEVQINGKIVCTAGIGDFGVLTSNLGWVNVHPARRSKSESEDNLTDHLFLSVGGLTSNDKDEGEHLFWLDQRPIMAGDEIVIRILNQAICDDPIMRRSGDT
jgi:hypothetical protein